RRLAIFVYGRKRLRTPKKSRSTQLGAIKYANEAIASARLGVRYTRSTSNGSSTLVAIPLSDGGVVLVYSARPELPGQLGIVRRNLIIAAFIGIAGGSLAGLLIASLIAGRLRRILTAAEAIEGGDFAVRLRPRFRDELGQLAMTIDRMRERLRVSFGKVE